MDLAAGARHLEALDLVEHLDAALHLARLRRLVAEALDEALDLGDALGLVARAGLQQRAAGLALDQEVVVVAGIDDETLGREVGDRRDHPIQEVTVVRDDDHGAVVAGEEVLQPRQGGEVEVVGRLVEQQQRGRQQQQPGERRPHPPASGEFAERLGHLVGTEAQAAQDRARLRLEPVAAQRLEAVLQLAVPLGQRLARRRLQRARHVLHLTLERPHRLETAQRLGQHRAGHLAGGLLRQVADGHAARPAHLSGVGLLHPRQDPAEGRLAGAVGADQADALALGDPPGDVAEEELAAEALRDVFELDHRARITPCSGSSRA